MRLSRGLVGWAPLEDDDHVNDVSCYVCKDS